MSRCARRNYQSRFSRERRGRGVSALVIGAAASVSNLLTIAAIPMPLGRDTILFTRDTSTIDSRRAVSRAAEPPGYVTRDTWRYANTRRVRGTENDRKTEWLPDTSQTSTGNSRTCHVPLIRSVHLHLCFVRVSRNIARRITPIYIVSVLYQPERHAVFLSTAQRNNAKYTINIKFISTYFRIQNSRKITSHCTIHSRIDMKNYSPVAEIVRHKVKYF